MEDDVIELWSCLKKSNINKSKKKKWKTGGENALFMIDKTPNPKYLRCLKTNAKYVEKEKKQDLFHIKTTFKLIKPVKEKTLKCLDSSQKKRWREDNLDFNTAESNTHHSKKKIRKKNSDENSSQTNSTYKLREIVVDGCNVAMTYVSIISLIMHIIDEFSSNAKLTNYI